jgi:very-short-patch-repair endonuclease
MTRAETLLWRYLKADRLAGLAFRRQTPMGPYIADFVAHSCKLIVELDGESHDFEDRVRHDERRDQWFVSRGYRVLRFTNDDVMKNLEGGCSFHYRSSGASGTPLPNPPPQGGRDPVQRCVPD